MTSSPEGVLWVTGRDPLPTRLERAVVWLMPHADADQAMLPPASCEDRRDAAAAKRDGGAPRLLRRRLLRALLASLSGMHPEAVRFGRNAAGAPFVLGLDACLSGAGCEGWSAVAVASGPVGVDIEWAPPAELDAMSRWTVVEAYLKASGLGLRSAPEEVVIDASAGEAAPPFVVTSAGFGSGRGWLHAPAPHLFAAVVVLDRAGSAAQPLRLTRRASRPMPCASPPAPPRMRV